MVDRPQAPPGAVGVWQIMTGLNITTRVEAIEYLRFAVPGLRLSAGEIRGLLHAFPILPPGSARRGSGARPGYWRAGVERDAAGGVG